MDSSRPTAEERRAAGVALNNMMVAKIVLGKATRSSCATIACAVALHAGETFASDNAAKRAFGVKLSTNVRKLWLPRLQRLDELRRGPPEIVLADGSDGDQPPPATPFQCRHEPSCTSADAHQLLCRQNAAARRERWATEHRPRAPPKPDPPARRLARLQRSMPHLSLIHI